MREEIKVSFTELIFFKKRVATLELEAVQLRADYDHLKQLHEQCKQSKIIANTGCNDNITKSKRVEDALQDEDGKYRLVFDSANDAIFIHDLRGQILEVNSMACDRLGYTQTELRSMTVRQVNTPDEAIHIPERFEKLQRLGCLTFEVVHQCKDGTPVPTEVSARQITWAGQPAIMSICRNLKKRKQAEAYRDMTHEVLHVLNEPEGTLDFIPRILDVLIKQTGFDAVGIRLQKGNDFPYIAQKGFPDDFLQLENTLIQTRDGIACRDQNGKVLLAGTCGQVISGEFNPDSPFFTRGGSFWVNDSAKLLDISFSNDHRSCRRNQCIYHNYSSYALVPIRNKERIVGLIHFSDHRKECFSVESIEILEGIASHIGAVLMRKRAEEALMEEQKRLADIIDFLPDATLAIDQDGRVIIWNKAMEKMTGISALEMVGKSNHAYAIPFFGVEQKLLLDLLFASSEEIKAKYPLAIREGDTLISQMHCKCLCSNERTWYFAKASPLRDRFGKIIGAIESLRNITDNKHAEEDLRETVARFKALFNATADSVILVKPDGIILDLNENAACRRNVVKEIMRGQTLYDFLPLEAAVTRRQAIAQVLNERMLVQYDETRYDKQYRIRLYPVMDEHGNVIQIASFSRDITEGKHAEEENRRLQVQLIQAQKMEAIGTLAGGIAHDFNNILSAIVGYTEMAKVASSSELVRIKYLDKVLGASNRAVALVKQILTFSRRSQTGSVPLNPAIIIKEVIKLLRPSLPSTIAIRQDIDTISSTIKADPTQLHQIIMNLCTNAFHAMEHDGGNLDIVLKDCELSSSDLLVHPEVQPGRFVLLSIGDTGSGVASEIHDKIFDPYFTTKGIGKGTGLGLAIVHGIVTSYGGFITCESERAKGTVFNVYFPSIEEEVVREVKPIEVNPLGTERILLVDDEEVLVDMGKVMLEQLGYEVTIQTSSQEALTIFQNQPNQFDAVITDQTMPGMTGMDLAKQMLQSRPNIPIILCSGYSTLISEEQAKADGVKAFAMKPLTMTRMATLLREVLDNNLPL